MHVILALRMLMANFRNMVEGKTLTHLQKKNLIEVLYLGFCSYLKLLNCSQELPEMWLFPRPSPQKENLLNKKALKTQIEKLVDLINKANNRMDATCID